MVLQQRQLNTIQDRRMGGGKDHRRGKAIFLGFFPSVDAQAPAVSRLESGETGRWDRGAQIVAPTLGKCQEGIGYLGADAMPANVVGSDTAVTVTLKTSQRMQAAGFQRFTENI